MIKLIQSDELIDVPVDIAICPKCEAPLYCDFDEWETETGRITDCGLHLNCTTEPDIDSDEWEEWLNWHYAMPYVDWLPLQEPVHKWVDRNYRVKR